MEWSKPQFTRGEVDRAGRSLVSDDPSGASEASLQVINNWRASHYYPLNTFKVTLRRKAQEVDAERLVAQRIKRLSSIDAKLRRFPTMQLSKMQDIGGCRAIVATSDQVNRLRQKYEKSDLKHKLAGVDDYLASPKASGYRSIHLKYKYFSDKKAPAVYNGLGIEVQLRSRLQHAWATAVETVGTFLSQALKSSQGEDRWLRFFALAGSAIAIREGSTALVPETPTKKTALIAELRRASVELNVERVLKTYSQVIRVTEEGTTANNHYFLLKLEPKTERMTVTGFNRRDLEKASELYLEAEKDIQGTPGSEAVLVSVDSLNSLKRAYPNYFLDTDVFLHELKEAVRR